MSNLAMEKFLNSQNIKVLYTQVGDRYVYAKMKELGLSLGGEQSGHIIVGDYATTGDGLVAALQMLALIKEENKRLSELANIFTPFPQFLRNVHISDPNILDRENVIKSIKMAEEKIFGKGRILVRKSGTENLIRIMGESNDVALIKVVMDALETSIIGK